MSTLSDLVYVTGKGLSGDGGLLSECQRDLLKNITPRKQNYYKKHEEIPWQVLTVLWELEFLPGSEKLPSKMSVSELLVFLRQENYRSELNVERGQWLYEKIVQEELMQSRNYGKRNNQEIFLKIGPKFTPASMYSF